MASKTGVPTLLKISIRLCKYLNKYTLLISLLYPTNSALIAALAAARAACDTLSAELEAVREYGD